MGQVSYGTITITDTNDIESIVVEYNRNQSTTDAPAQNDSDWSTTRPAWGEGWYIWQRTRTHKSGTTASDDVFGTAVCITGSTGQTGGSGTPGRSLTNTVTTYTTAAASATITQNNMNSYTWSSNVPSYNKNTPAYWVRVTNTYSNPSSTEYIIYKDNGITDSMATAASANSIAQSASDKADDAWDKADNAEEIAGDANTNATNAYNIATGINQHFWTITTDYATGIPAGSYITDTAIDTFKSQKTGGNLLTRSDGIYIRNGINTLAELTGTGLNFYNPQATQGQNTLLLSIGANGVLQSGNFVYTSGTYSDSGTKIDLTNGSIYTPGFRTDGSNTYIRGEINALSGKIGNNSSNYWTIGNYYNYDQTASAALISHGTAFIQLDTSNTWRLSTDRIHTAWNGTDGSAALMFPKDGNTYWDWGVHSPHQTNNVWKDKFVYARKYTNTTDDDFTNRDNLSNDLDDDLGLWTYQFYIDKNGSIYARNFYLLNEDGTPGSNIGGQDAVYLLKSGGTISGNLEVNGTLTKGSKNVAYLSTTPTSGQILVADGTAGGIKTSGYTIATSVPSGAVFTDKNVRSTNANTTKLWLVGTDTSGDRTGELNYDTNIYIDTTAGALHATTYNGYTLAAASAKGVDTSMPTTATDSNVPTTKLMKSFIEGKNYLTSETDPTVPSWAKAASKPSYALSEITGADDVKAIEALTGTNGLLKKTAANTWTLDTNTYLTSYTETDPIFVASAAHGITSSDISNWNSKTSNTGTVTSVAASGSGGISISGSPITTSGTITIGLNLSTAINELGEGTSPATRDDYIVAQYAGGGTTTTTYHRRKLSNIFAALNSSDITTALGYTPYNSTNPNGYITANHTSTYSLPIAKYNTLGGVKPAYSSTGAVSLTTAAATNTTTPTIAAKTTTSGRYYAVEVDKNGVLFVNVPWTNVNSSYLTSSSTLNWNNITQNKPTTASGYGITDAITNVSATSASGGSTTFTLTKSNGTTSTFDVVVYASAASQATDANYLTDGTTRYSVGSAKKPIYFDGGIPKASDGTEGTSTKPVYLSSGTITAGSTYAGGTKVTLNNSDKGASTASFYAPTSGGTSTQVLIGNGTTSAPVWTSISSLVPTSATNATNATYATYDASEANNTTKTAIADKYIPKSIGTAAGDIIYWSASGTPVRLAKGSNGQVLKLANGVPTWGTDNNDNTTYSLSGSLSSHKFTTTLTPSSGSATTSAFTLAAGSNISLTDSGTTITIAATDTNTATAVDNILDGSNSGTAITYAPYTSKQSGLSLYTGTTAPDGTTRLNLNGYLYATKLYSGGAEVLTAHQSLSNYKTKQTAITAPMAVTNKWVNTLAQNTNGEVTVTYSSLDTSGTWSGNATTATTASKLGSSTIGGTGTPIYLDSGTPKAITTAISASLGGTGQTSLINACNSLLNALSTGSSTPVDADYYISQYVGGGTTTTTYHRRPMSALWSYISGKISNSGTYVTIATDQTITASQKTFNGAIRWGTTSEYGAVNYDSTLDALVFSFA